MGGRGKPASAIPVPDSVEPVDPEDASSLSSATATRYQARERAKSMKTDGEVLKEEESEEDDPDKLK